jgi:hypothetical protein
MNEILHIPVDGQYAAILVTDIPHKHHLMFKAILESGYSNIFYTDVETGLWIEEDLGFTDLAQQIGQEVKKMKLKPIHVPKLLTWHKLVVNHRIVSFGFFSFLNGDNKMFEIYDSKKKYLYTLVEMGRDEWHIMSHDNVRVDTLDSNFIHEVTKVLPLYSYFD